MKADIFSHLSNHSFGIRSLNLSGLTPAGKDVALWLTHAPHDTDVTMKPQALPHFSSHSQNQQMVVSKVHRESLLFIQEIKFWAKLFEVMQWSLEFCSEIEHCINVYYWLNKAYNAKITKCNKAAAVWAKHDGDHHHHLSPSELIDWEILASTVDFARYRKVEVGWGGGCLSRHSGYGRSLLFMDIQLNSPQDFSPTPSQHTEYKAKSSVK